MMRFNIPERITVANAGQCKAQIAEALRTQNLTKLKQDSQFRELVSKIHKACDMEDGLAPDYRSYLTARTRSMAEVPATPGMGRVIVSAKGRPSDIAEMEEKFINHSLSVMPLGCNPFSGFICTFGDFDEERLGPEIDALLDPGGP